jgi:ABC-type uncharacterized transport system ATPase subunit
MTPPLLTLTDITRSFGAGRTKLARVLFGVTPADSGEIFLHGRRSF